MADFKISTCLADIPAFICMFKNAKLATDLALIVGHGKHPASQYRRLLDVSREFVHIYSLRCHCLKAERDAKTAAFLSEGDINLTLMLNACPSPAFILKDERTIIARNPAFAVRFTSVTDGDQKARNHIRIFYTKLFSKLRQFLQRNPNKALNPLIVLSSGNTVYN